MSAIWGVVDWNKLPIEVPVKRRMKEVFESYKIDCFQERHGEDYYFGYGGQYFTQESHYEEMPIVNPESDVFVADVVVDNRQEMLKKLQCVNDNKIYPDGNILYDVVKTNQFDQLNQVQGMFSFAFYNQVNKNVVLGVDPLACRCLYYYFKDGRLYFSTLIKAILGAVEEDFALNERWISDFLALDSLNIYVESEETYFKDIRRVEPGEVVVFSLEEIEKYEYWRPLEDIKINYKKRDEEYKKEFIDTFKTVVKDAIRSDEEVAILLSGGLDSSSVACFAGPMLKKKNRKLYSFTSVPIKEYVSDNVSEAVYNEKDLVEVTKKFLGNLEPMYLDSQGVNGWDGSIDLMTKLELPFKSLQNIKWMLESLEEAEKKKCRILLTGQYGNVTISFGELYVYFNTLIKRGKLVTLVKEINECNRQYHWSRKEVYQDLLKARVPHNKSKIPPEEELFGTIYLKKELLKKYSVAKRFVETGHANATYLGMNMNDIRSYIPDKVGLVHMGEIETKLSLVTGVLMRDPTRDRRIIELCLRLPEDQFVKNGIPRRLVREYLHEFLPTEISEQMYYKGVQSVDIFVRLQKDWNRIYREAIEMLDTEIATRFLEVDKLKDELMKYKDGIPKEYDFEILKLLYSILFTQFLDSMSKKTILQRC